MQKNSLIALLLALASLTGCASASLKQGGIAAVTGPMRPKYRDMDLKDRQKIFDEHRLTWSGRYVEGGNDTLSNMQLVKYLEDSGAGDLAALASKTKPALTRDEPREKKPRRSRASDRYPDEPSWKGPINGSLGGDDKAAAFLLAGAAAGAAAYGTFVAVKSVVEGIISDLNPNPTLEDILEAYNQRLAYALGLDYNDTALFTAMPRPADKPQMIARDQRHGVFLVRSGIGASLIGMGIGSASALFEYSQSRPTPAWSWPTFYASTGALFANLILGWAVVW